MKKLAIALALVGLVAPAAFAANNSETVQFKLNVTPYVSIESAPEGSATVVGLDVHNLVTGAADFTASSTVLVTSNAPFTLNVDGQGDFAYGLNTIATLFNDGDQVGGIGANQTFTVKAWGTATETTPAGDYATTALVTVTQP